LAVKVPLLWRLAQQLYDRRHLPATGDPLAILLQFLREKHLRARLGQVAPGFQFI